MKIAYLHQYFHTPSQAGSTRSYEFARRWVSAGDEVHVVTSVRTRDRTHRGWRVRHVDGIAIHEVAVPYDNQMGAAARVRAFFEFAIRAGPRAGAIQPDVLFATSTPLTIAIPAAYAKIRTRAPLVFEVRDLWPAIPIAMGIISDPLSRMAARWLERFAYRTADRIIALSPGMADGVSATGVHNQEIVVIPNACDLELFGSPQGSADEHGADVWASKFANRTMCLYAGTIGRVNGLSYIVDIAAESRSIAPEILFLIVGDGKEAGLVRRQAEDCGVLNRTLYLQEPLPKRSVASLFEACSVALSVVIDLPEMWHNSANKFFDALAAGRPVAINYGGWQADLVARHDLGLVLPVKSPREAAHMLADFVADREAVSRCGSNARRLAEQEFGRDNLSDRARKLVHSVASGRVTERGNRRYEL